jgi:ribosome biogenesis GTPase
MKPEDFGYNEFFESARRDSCADNFEIGRVIAEHRERYIVKTVKGEFEAEISGNLRFTSKSREDFPAVGDWVTLSIYDTDAAIIHKILPRSSLITRHAVGQSSDIQVIASNIDCAFLVQAVDRDFNINRLERYLTICNSSNVKPVIVLTKTDLINESRLSEILESIRQRIREVPVVPISNESQNGYELLENLIEKGKTYCLLGSSGVGKSTLLNNLSGNKIMRTDTISQSTNKGRHITSHRELIILDNGGILIDNPGIREVGIADTTGGLEITFNKIFDLSAECRFKDCTHVNEAGCAVLEALEAGEIARASYENYLKMEREKAHFESTIEEKRKRDKSFGKMLKNYKKDMRKNDY